MTEPYILPSEMKAAMRREVETLFNHRFGLYERRFTQTLGQQDEKGRWVGGIIQHSDKLVGELSHQVAHLEEQYGELITLVQKQIALITTYIKQQTKEASAHATDREIDESD